MIRLNPFSTLVGVAIVAGMSGVWASDKNPGPTIVRGSAVVQSADGRWVEAVSVPVGQWVRSAKTDTTLRVPGMIIRVEPGAKVRFDGVKDGVTQMDAKGGRVFVKVDSDQRCLISTSTHRVDASGSEFVLDTGDAESLYVLNGNAQMAEIQPKPAATAKAWKKFAAQVALDGPDVRKRGKNRKRFVQGEQNTGKRVTEEPTRTASPSPTFTQTPVYTPPATPPPPSPAPTPAPQVSGGGQIWPYFLPLLGGGIYAATRRNDDDERPISP